MISSNSLLLVANYISDVGYAWWLMESFWVKIAEYYHSNNRIILSYPIINILPKSISNAPLQAVSIDFSKKNLRNVVTQCIFLKKNRVKAIYFSDHETWHWRYGLFRIFCVRYIIVHDHTPGTRTIPFGLKMFLKRLLHRIPFFTADGAIGSTHFVRKRLIEVNGFPASRCYAAPNGLPPFTHSPIDLHELFSIPNNRLILVMTGRAHLYKGIDFVLECMAFLTSYDNSINLHFLFIGDGPHLQNLIQKATELKVINRCTFPGKRKDVPSLIAGADIAIHPSHGEVGYSLSILEYMSAGLPVVLPDNPSVCSTIKHGFSGFIYSDGDLHSAACMIKCLVKDDALRKRLGAQAMIASQEYSLKNTHIALIEAFRKIDRKGILSAA